jgi:hypothetical protein
MAHSLPDQHPTHIEVGTPSPGDGQTVSAADAMGGQKTGHMRWVLSISVVMAVVVMIAAFMVMVRHPDRGGLGGKGVNSAPASSTIS